MKQRRKTNNPRWGLVVAAMLFGSAWLPAQELSLDLEAAISQALEENRDLRLAARDVSSAQRKVDQAWGELLPSLNASASLSNSRSPINEPAADASTQLSGSVSASLPLRVSLRDAIEQTRLDLNSAEITYEQARLELINSVEGEFLYLLAYQDSVELEELSLELARQRHEVVREQYERGRASELELLEARAAVASQEPSVVSERATYQRRLRNFASLLGIDRDTMISLEGDLSAERNELDADELADRFVWSRLDIRAQQASIASLENSLEITRESGLYPSVSLSAGWSASRVDPFGDRDAGWNDSLSIGLGVSIPIDSWIGASSTGQAITAARERVAAAALSLEQLVADAHTEIANAVASVDTAWSQIEAAEVSVTLYNRTYEMTEEAYQRGTRSLNDVNDAQRSYLDARQTVLENQYQYRSALIDLRAALGVESLAGIAN